MNLYLANIDELAFPVVAETMVVAVSMAECFGTVKSIEVADPYDQQEIVSYMMDWGHADQSVYAKWLVPLHKYLRNNEN